MVLPLLARGPY